MEGIEDIVIVGAGIAGLTTALGLHRLGVKSLVLESLESLRVTGFAFTTWANAWRALDALGIGESLRQQHHQLHGFCLRDIVNNRIVAGSTISGLPTAEVTFMTEGSRGHHEARCMKRKVLLEALQKELPNGTIKFSSKVVTVEDSGRFKLVHLADGSNLKTKVLIGCDGINSKVAESLGLNKPAFTGRAAIRGYVDFKSNHHRFEHKFLQFNGEGVRSGFLPCDDNTVYWFFTFTPSTQEKEMEGDPGKMKEFVLRKLSKVPDQVKAVIDVTNLDNIICSPLRFRHPWELLLGGEKISKGNVCVAGDALHPMTPDIAQGGCSALEDGVILARCLASAFTDVNSETRENAEEERKEIEEGLKRFARERRWRSSVLISTAYVVGLMQQSGGVVMSFLRDKILAGFLARLLLKMADFDCGKLNIP